ncbi:MULTISPECIES: hypothetical protein [unclassified Sphingomonas]|uniref:hypothetical protein n=1 Tax=unclassified Sphingomonas TaxID=196159 RepID=UPI0012E2A7D6|nr:MULTISPECIES: hypothetical protein [unclassified Sphingomonas]
MILRTSPLTARPAGTQEVLLVDVVALVSLRNDPYVARLRIVGDPRGKRRKGSTLALSYLRPPCGGMREPSRGERLVVYLRGGTALGWATMAEARTIR